MAIMIVMIMIMVILIIMIEMLIRQSMLKSFCIYTWKDFRSCFLLANWPNISLGRLCNSASFSNDFTYITHSFPMLPFSTPCKHQKTVRVEKGCIWSKWINEISKLNKFFAVDSYAFVGLIIHSTSEIRFSSSVKNAEVIV